MKQTLGIFFLFLWSLAALAQENNVTGTVTDANDGSPIPGVSVSIKGTTTGSVTNLDGVYSLNAKQGDVLVFSFIGMKSVEATVNGSSVNASLSANVTDLDDVVVVGYGVKKKSLITGATSSVSAADMSSSVVRAEQALQGKAPGVTATPQSGSPGSAMKVRIRGAGSNGNSDPLYIVDGMRTGDISFLAPSDIESMEVLKDAASSAIYGAEGANGVVLIKTKTGAKGEAKINYNFQYGTQSLPNNPDMMNASQYATYMTEAGRAGAPNPATLTDAEGTNWLNEIEETAPMQSHSISVSGGTDKGSYLISGGYDQQDGVIGGSKAAYERITTRVNLTQEVKPWLEVGANIAYTHSTRSSITENDGFNGIVNSALMMDPTGKALYAQPTAYMQSLIDGGQRLNRDADGNYYGLSNNDFLKGEIYNPLLRLATEKGINTDDKILTSEYVKIMPFKGFSFTSRLGLDLAFNNYNSWSPSYYGNSRSLNNAPNVTDNDQKWSTWMWENFASYNKKLEAHNFTIMAGVSAQEYNYLNLNTTSGLMIKEDDQFRYPDYTTNHDGKASVGGRKETQTKNSYFGRLSYDYNNKYLAEVTFRRDGSSLFGTNNRYGSFPSVSAGWVVSEEEFWGLEAINFLKIRASWGQNGSLSNLGVDQYRSLITTTGIEYPDGSGVLQPGAEPDLLANADLKWETSEQTDLGFDIRALNGMIYGSFDAYRKVTKDLLTPATPALSHGNDAPYWNAGEVTNSGLEFLVGVQDKAAEFSYDVNMNFTLMKNEVTYMSDGVTRIGGANLPTIGNITYMETGEPIYYYRGYETEGIFRDQAQIDAWIAQNKITDKTYKPVPGDVIVKNNVDDGTVSDKDMANIGSPHPDMILGANINLGYKGFDFNMFMQGAFGQENYIGFMRADNMETNKLAKFFDDRWTPTDHDATMPRAGNATNYFYKSDLMVESGSYMKIRQIQLGYTLPKAISSKALISNARVYVSLNDFFTFSSYSGMDPEVGSNNNNAQGIDFGVYPVSKKVLFGLAVTF